MRNLNSAVQKETIRLDNFADFKQVGINFLTGEACEHGTRILCDITAQGKEILESFLGAHLEMNPPMNTYGFEGDEVPVGSMMLARSAMKDIGKYALFHLGAIATIESDNMMGPGQTLGLFSRERVASYSAHNRNIWEQAIAATGNEDILAIPEGQAYRARMFRITKNPDPSINATHHAKAMFTGVAKPAETGKSSQSPSMM